jgi:hypothetical protein
MMLLQILVERIERTLKIESILSGMLERALVKTPDMRQPRSKCNEPQGSSINS